MNGAESVPALLTAKMPAGAQTSAARTGSTGVRPIRAAREQEQKRPL